MLLMLHHVLPQVGLHVTGWRQGSIYAFRTVIDCDGSTLGSRASFAAACAKKQCQKDAKEVLNVDG